MEDTETFGFGLEYAGELIYCEVKMQEVGYDIYFDGRYVASIMVDVDRDMNFDWLLTNGLLTNDVISMIGAKIQNHYE